MGFNHADGQVVVFKGRLCCGVLGSDLGFKLVSGGAVRSSVKESGKQDII